SGPIIRTLWLVWRRLGLRNPNPTAREGFLGSFAPFGLVVLLVVWVFGLVTGYALVLHGLRQQLRPVPDFGAAMYFSGTSLLTVGYGDIVPRGGLARVVALVEAANGFG